MCACLRGAVVVVVVVRGGNGASSWLYRHKWKRGCVPAASLPLRIFLRPLSRAGSAARRRLFPSGSAGAAAGVPAAVHPGGHIMAGLDPQLNRLLRQQQATHVGVGGLAAALPADERATLLTVASRNRPAPMRQAFTAGPDEPDAADSLALFIANVIDALTASNYHLKEMEAMALVYLDQQFEGKAGHQWTTVKTAARVEATTSGIGVHSVLYRSLRDMLGQYPVYNIKNDMLAKKALDLRWDAKQSTPANRTRLQVYYDAYDRAVNRTATLDLASRLPAQTWDVRLAELQSVWPPWIKKLIADAPARFNTEAGAWACILEADGRMADSRRAMNAGGSRLHQLAAEMEAAGLGFTDDLPFEDYDGAGCFAMPRAMGCWRCGSNDHRRSQCPHPASAAELAGLPADKWARTSPPPVKPTPTSSSVVAHITATNARLDRQEVLLSRLLEGLAASPALRSMPTEVAPSVAALSPTTAGLQGAPVFSSASTAPVIMGGPQPPGYAQLGHNQGVPLWIQEPLLAASIAVASDVPAADAAVSGNEMGSQ